MIGTPKQRPRMTVLLDDGRKYEPNEQETSMHPTTAEERARFHANNPPAGNDKTPGPIDDLLAAQAAKQYAADKSGLIDATKPPTGNGEGAVRTLSDIARDMDAAVAARDEARQAMVKATDRVGELTEEVRNFGKRRRGKAK